MRSTIAMTRVVTENDVDAMPAELRERLTQAFQERDN